MTKRKLDEDLDYLPDLRLDSHVVDFISLPDSDSFMSDLDPLENSNMSIDPNTQSSSSNTQSLSSSSSTQSSTHRNVRPRIDLNQQLLESTELGDLPTVQSMINLKADIETLNDDKNTPLHIASRFGHYKIVDYLISARANLNAMTCSDNLAIHITDSIATAQVLIDAGLSVNSPGYKGYTPLMQAIYCNNYKLVDFLLKMEANLLHADDDGNNSIHHACIAGNLSIAKLVLEPLILNVPGYNGNTPLICATINNHYSIAQYLIESKANLEVRNDIEYNALMCSIEHGNLFIAQLLIESGSDINIMYNGVTLLHLAVMHNQLDSIRFLLHMKMDINSESKKEDSPLHFATWYDKYKAGKLLIDLKADIECKDGSGRTPLHCAAQKNNVKFIELLINSGASINSRNHNNSLPIHVAAYNTAIDTVEYLLQQPGMHLEVKGFEGQTLLGRACVFSNCEMINFLLQRNANIDAKDDLGRTPLRLALENKRDDVASLLLSKGANIHILDNDSRVMVQFAYGSTLFKLLGHGAKLPFKDFGTFDLGNLLGYGPYLQCTKAIMLSRYEIFDQLVSRLDDVNVKDYFGMTLLMWAAVRGESKITKILLGKGVNALLENKNGETALMLAKGKCVKMIYNYLEPMRNAIMKELDYPEAVGTLIAEYIYGGRLGR